MTMSRSRGSPPAVIVALLTAAVGLPGRTIRAQTADEPALKAAFLHNFVRFTEWPPSTASAGPLALCVLDAEPVARELEAVERSQAAAGVVLRLRPEDNPRACALLYVGDLPDAKAQALLQRLAGAPVLTVGDSASFTHRGGVINFYVEQNRVRFAINVEAAHRARLQISSRLLSLATIVKGTPDGQP
jgi:hypothetical protein